MERSITSLLKSDIRLLFACCALAIVKYKLLEPSINWFVVWLAILETVPHISTIKAELVIFRSPVLVPIASVVPIMNLSWLSSQPINRLLWLPLSITNPLSPIGWPIRPLPNSINWSLTLWLVTVYAPTVPVTISDPCIIKFSLKVLLPPITWSPIVKTFSEVPETPAIFIRSTNRVPLDGS